MLRSALLIAFGFVLCGFGIPVGQILFAAPAQVTNESYTSVHIETREGSKRFSLGKGASIALGYGSFIITIPEIQASFTLHKNSRGSCVIRSAKGMLLVETNGNASVATEDP